MYGKRLQTWDRTMEWPLVAAAILFLIAYGTEVTVGPDGTGRAAAGAVIWGAWVVFLVDYVVRLSLAENRGRWFRTHLLDLAIVALPMLRPLRLMRFITVLAILQRSVGRRLRGQVMLYTIGANILIIVVAGLAVLDAERDAGTITTFGDAVWWAFATVTTVGYGDFAPVTMMGRAIAVCLMICGIALIGVVTATLASWIVERITDDVEEQDAARDAATQAQVEALRHEIAELSAMVRELQPGR